MSDETIPADEEVKFRAWLPRYQREFGATQTADQVADMFAAWTACARQHAGREAAAHAEGERAATARVRALVEAVAKRLHGVLNWRVVEPAVADLLAAIDAPAHAAEQAGATKPPFLPPSSAYGTTTGNPGLAIDAAPAVAEVAAVPAGQCSTCRGPNLGAESCSTCNGRLCFDCCTDKCASAPVAPAPSVVKVRIAVGVGPGGWDAYGSSYIDNNEDAPARVRATRPSVAVVHWVEAEVPRPVSETVKGTVTK